MNRTKSKKIGGVEYCIYCGNESIHDVDYYNHGREEDHFEKCGCEELKQVKIKEQTISNMQNGLNRFIEECANNHKMKFLKLEYEAELKELKVKYDQ